MLQPRDQERPEPDRTPGSAEMMDVHGKHSQSALSLEAETECAPRPARARTSELQVNHDDSVDIIFGPIPPTNGETNWLQTEPDRGWFTDFRWYGPPRSSSTRPGDCPTSPPADPS